LKRVLDLTISATALVLLAPVFVVVALLVLVTMGRPVFYRHQRVGFAGKPFDCYKFRTMVTNGDEVLQKHLSENPEAAEEWRLTRKLRNDPRISGLGHLLRKSSIDELPQLINVLKGEMSCVGPRPVVFDELQYYGSEAKQYLKARPGISGPWQVAGRSRLGYEKRVSLDSEYIQNWSLFRDLLILVKTIPAVIRIDSTS
jgi:exopolysaccharide production protein ExoY